MLRIHVAAALVVASLGVATVVPAAALPDDPWPYVWPVDAPVVEGFRPPATPYGPGNRGLEFATVPGTAVRSAGSGRVLFAGQVGGRLHVTVAHADRLRVSYSGLATMETSRGARLGQGEQLGTTADRLHVGVRLGTAYLDPAIVFGGRRVVRLVPASRASPGLVDAWSRGGFAQLDRTATPTATLPRWPAIAGHSISQPGRPHGRRRSRRCRTRCR